MIDYNYWKNKYQKLWAIAASKEEKVRKIIEQECDCACEFTGLGAGKTSYFAGSAKSRGFEKGGSDLHVKGTNIFIEVTGPNVDWIKKEAALWVRPDKIQYAINHKENDHWVVHVLQKDFYPRAIHMDDKFKEDYQNSKFNIIHPWIRRAEETYVEIPADSEHVQSIEKLFEAIKTSIES